MAVEVNDQETVVGVFANENTAREALRRMDEAGFAPDRVGLVADNVRQAREAAGSFSLESALVGAALGVVASVVVVLAGGEAMRQNVVAIVLGTVGFVVAGIAIGALAGRSKAFKAHDYQKYEKVVERGDALVTVRCEPGERAKASNALKAAGATAVRVEESAEGV